MKKILTFFLVSFFLIGCSNENLYKQLENKIESLKKKTVTADLNKLQNISEEYELMISLMMKATNQNFMVLRQLGIQSLKRGMYDLSIKSLERAIELKSDDYNVYYYLGISYAYKGKLDKKFNTKALDNYLKALRLKPNNSEINYSISVLYYYNLGNRKKGLEYMLEAFKYSDKEHKIPAVLGKYYFDEKSYDSSISYYKIALNKATNNTNKADYCGYISKIYKTMKKFGLAEEYLKKARKYNSNYKLKINE